MIVSLIVAASENNVIGKKNNIPWDLPDELQYFRSVTKGSPVIMGRKTYESIGHPLPYRRNIVVSGTMKTTKEYEVVPTLYNACELFSDSNEEIFIIGGARMFEEAIAGIRNPDTGDIAYTADRIYLTRVHTKIDGDVYFYDLGDEWKEVSSKSHGTDEKHEYAFTFKVFERVV